MDIGNKHFQLDYINTAQYTITICIFICKTLTTALVSKVKKRFKLTLKKWSWS